MSLIQPPLLQALGIRNATVHHNLGVDELYAAAIRLGEGVQAATGPLTVRTNKAGRSPKDTLKLNELKRFLAFAEPDHERGVAACGDDHVVVVSHDRHLLDACVGAIAELETAMKGDDKGQIEAKSRALEEAAQSLLQLMGAKGYRLDHIAGRALVDSRPFQIFEGSNDILYQQISEAILKSMRRLKETNLYRYLSEYELSSRAADYFKELINFEVDLQLPQRKLVELGRALGRIISMEMTIELGERGYRPDLIRNALEEFRTEVRGLLDTYRQGGLTALVEDYRDARGWLDFAHGPALR